MNKLILESGNATNLRAYRSAEQRTVETVGTNSLNPGSCERKKGVTGMKDRTSCENKRYN